MPPSHAVNAGFTVTQLNEDYSTGDLDLACDGIPPGTKRWHQGLWWERPTAPCNQISITYDPVAKKRVLDLRWLASQTDPFDATAIETISRDFQHVRDYRHGYYEAIFRLPQGNKPGVWSSFMMWNTESVLFANTPPWQTAPANEIDVIEGHGEYPTLVGSEIHEWGTGASAFIYEGYEPNFDYRQYHKYGLLWTGNGQWKEDTVCFYLDDVQKACQSADASAVYSRQFLILSMGVGCNFKNGDRSCLAGLKQADMLVQSVRVWSCSGPFTDQAAGC
jgi:hypothetical protein